MTKKKIVLEVHRMQWKPIIDKCIELLFNEQPRTNNTGERAKIRVKMHKDFHLHKKWPKCIMVPCEDEGYVIREWPAWRLLDFLHSTTHSRLSSKDVYTQRRGVMKMVDNMLKELDV